MKWYFFGSENPQVLKIHKIPQKYKKLLKTFRSKSRQMPKSAHRIYRDKSEQVSCLIYSCAICIHASICFQSTTCLRTLTLKYGKLIYSSVAKTILSKYLKCAASNIERNLLQNKIWHYSWLFYNWYSFPTFSEVYLGELQREFLHHLRLEATEEFSTEIKVDSSSSGAEIESLLAPKYCQTVTKRK